MEVGSFVPQVSQETKSSAYYPLLPNNPIVTAARSYLIMEEEIPEEVRLGLADCLRSAQATSMLCSTSDFELARQTLIEAEIWDQVSSLLGAL